MLPSELERALSTGRVWTREELDALGADLTRRLLWAQYDGARVERVFRLEAEGPRGLAEEPVALDAGPIRLVHPGELDPIARAAWGDALAALSILQPIPQLARPVHALSEINGAGDALVEFPRRQVHPDRVRRVLAGAGWEAGEPDERLRVAYFFKRFARADLVAVIRIEPGLSPSGAAPQTPVEAFFMARAPGGLTSSRPRASRSERSPPRWSPRCSSSWAGSRHATPRRSTSAVIFLAARGAARKM
ncbi:MAG: DUF4132 domain-containing protein [Sandaracinaceae bacterium]